MVRPILYRLYILTLVLFVGGIAMFSFVVMPGLFFELERGMAVLSAKVVVPYYFLYNLGLLLVALLLFILFAGNRKSYYTYYGTLGLLILAIGAGVFNQLWLYPQMKAILARITDFSTPAANQELRAVLAHLHRVGTYLNLGFLAAGLGLLLLSPFHLED